MKTRPIIVVGSMVGFLALFAVLLNTSDLRGWPPADGLSRHTLMKATTPTGTDFTLTACWSPSIDRYALPGSRELQGTTSETVVACRSRHSLAAWTGAYFLLTIAALGLSLIPRLRRRFPR